MGPGVLVIVYKGIGDVLLTTPLLRALKKGLPDSRLYFLTRRPSRKILENNPRLSGVFFREDKPLAAIRKAGIDISLDFMRSSSSGFYALFSGAKKRLAFHFPAGRLFHNVLPRKKDARQYTVLDRLELLEPLAIMPDGAEPELSFLPANAARAETFLASAGVRPGEPVITFDITSPREHRRWAPERFAELADRLASAYGARVVFLWGPGELDYVKAAMAAASARHLLCPDFDLLDLAALQKRTFLHVGTSSAPMHVAVSQGTPTFVLYSPQNAPWSWTPPGARHAWAQGELDRLTLDEVWSKLGAHIESLKGVPA
ncbi:MAG: glycosyltransferase family 9 protein [Elusimicrobia bacterium]|nr:glycosyltransferase family 9 protein [Elusimicrobiota bacterium]